MHLLDLLERSVVTADDVAEALVYIESFLVRRMLCQVPTNNLNRVFNSAPAAIGNQAPVAAAVRSYLSGRRRYWPSDAEVQSSVRTRPFYWTGREARSVRSSCDGSRRATRHTSQSTSIPPSSRSSISCRRRPTDEWLGVLAGRADR